MKTGFNGAGGVGCRSVRQRRRRSVEDEGEVLAFINYVQHLATAGREGSSVGVGVGVGVGGVGGGGGGDGAGGWGGRRW